MAVQDRPARRTQEFAAIGRVMKLVMAEKGVSRPELVDRTGIAYNRVSQHLKGNGNPRYQTLKRLCDGLGVSLGEVMVRAEEMEEEDAVEAGDGGD